MRKGGATVGLAVALIACSSDKKATLVSSVEECTQRTRLDLIECQTQYNKAVKESRQTGPRYSDESSCTSEFQQCEELPSGQWIPVMEGFLVPEEEESSSRHHSYYHYPVYRYYRPYSSHHNSFMTGNGTVVGDGTTKNLSVPESALSSKRGSARTVSRGGFGAVATAKSRSSSGGFRGGFGS